MKNLFVVLLCTNTLMLLGMHDEKELLKPLELPSSTVQKVSVLMPTLLHKNTYSLFFIPGPQSVECCFGTDTYLLPRTIFQKEYEELHNTMQAVVNQAVESSKTFFAESLALYRRHLVERSTGIEDSLEAEKAGLLAEEREYKKRCADCKIDIHIAGPGTPEVQPYLEEWTCSIEDQKNMLKKLMIVDYTLALAKIEALNKEQKMISDELAKLRQSGIQLDEKKNQN